VTDLRALQIASQIEPACSFALELQRASATIGKIDGPESKRLRGGL